jgi:hypothetical protein
MLPLWVLRDERGLRRAAARLAAGGALGAVALSLLVVPVDAAGWLLRHFPLALAGGAILATAPFVQSFRLRALTALGLAAVAAAVLPAWPAVAPEAALFGLPAQAALGATTGLALVLGLLPRHLVMRPLRLWLAAASSRGGDQGEVEALTARGVELWQRVEQAAPGPEVKRALAGALSRLFAVARRWRELAQPGLVPAAPSVQAAGEMLERRRGETADPVTRARYAEAQRSVELQASHLAAIAASRERLLSHMHRHLAAMEALHLAAVTARSADAARNTEALRPMLEDLARLGDELDAGREVEVA